MKKSHWILIGIVAVIIIGGIASIVINNGIVSADQTVKEAWGNVESAYQRRLDLIPNLVNTVKGYAQHESSTLQGVTNARTGNINNAGAALQSLADSTTAELKNPQLSTEQRQEALSNFQREYSIYINAVHEAYPDLKASDNFKGLQDELTGTENRINTERTRYNEAVKNYNNKILRFPGCIFAGGRTEKEMFKADAAASKAPVVDFGTESAPAVEF